MGSLFRLTGDTVTPSAGTRVLKASEAAVLLEANAVLDAARERVADMERKAGEAYERRREEGYRDWRGGRPPRTCREGDGNRAVVGRVHRRH